MKKILVSILLILFTFITGCNIEGTKPVEDNKDEQTNEELKGKQMIRITLNNQKTINLELYPEVAPITVENFLNLIEQKYFDGLIFHRLIKDFMIQGGGYYVDGNTIHEKGKVEPIVGEFASNGIENNLKHELGVISMARTNVMNSATSQFFICTATSTHLDGNYAAFGKVIDEESLNTLLELNDSPTVFIDPSLANFPHPLIIIEKIEKIKK